MAEDRHGKEIPARDCTISVDCGDGAVMTAVNPYSQDSVGWAVRYGNVIRMRYVAASVIDSYDYLLSADINMKEATRRLRLLRSARVEARNQVLRDNQQQKEKP